MDLQVCPNCGAPMPPGEPGGVERCRFCEAEVREDPAPRKTLPEVPAFSPPFELPRLDPIPDDPPPPPKTWSMFLPILCVVGAAIIAVVSVAWSGSRKTKGSSTAGAATVVHGQIGAMTLSEHWQIYDSPGVPRGTHVDPVAQLAWFQHALATPWKADAALFDISANQAGRDGMVSLSDSSWIEYWFESPACWSAAPAGECGLHVYVDGLNGQARVRLAEYTKKIPRSPIRAIPCTMHDALDALQKAGRLPGSVYHVTLDDESTLRWTFQVSTTTSSNVGALTMSSTSLTPLATVDGTTCIPDPASTPSPSSTPATVGARCIVPLASVPPPVPRPAGARCPPDPASPYKLDRGRVTFPDSNATVDVEIARTADESHRGLMYRKTLPEGQGMLFVLDRKVQRFWMHNTCVPLDMLFIDDDGLIVGVAECAPVLDDGPQSVDCPSCYVLAVNAGWVRRHHVQPGQRVALPH